MRDSEQVPCPLQVVVVSSTESMLGQGYSQFWPVKEGAHWHTALLVHIPWPLQTVLMSETSGSKPGHTREQSSLLYPVVSKLVVGTSAREDRSSACTLMRLPVMGSVRDKNLALSQTQVPVIVQAPLPEHGVISGVEVSFRSYQNTSSSPEALEGTHDSYKRQSEVMLLNLTKLQRHSSKHSFWQASKVRRSTRTGSAKSQTPSYFTRDSPVSTEGHLREQVGPKKELVVYRLWASTTSEKSHWRSPQGNRAGCSSNLCLAVRQVL